MKSFFVKTHNYLSKAYRYMRVFTLTLFLTANGIELGMLEALQANSLTDGLKRVLQLLN